MHYESWLLLNVKITSRLTVTGSESRGQEEIGGTRRMSVLFTCSTAMKLVNTLNKLQ